MTLNFQNKIVFPAPETSYTTQSAFGQVVYIPRNIMTQVDRKFAQTRKHLNPKQAKKQNGGIDESSKDDKEKEYVEKSKANLDAQKAAGDKHQDPVIVEDADSFKEESNDKKNDDQQDQSQTSPADKDSVDVI